MIFKDKEYLKRLGACWTHDLDQLLRLADLQGQRDADGSANANLLGNWGVVLGWKETSRYEEKTQPEAEKLYAAITENLDGVMSWIKRYW
jgi:cell division inhibitor SulA